MLWIVFFLGVGIVAAAGLSVLLSRVFPPKSTEQMTLFDTYRGLNVELAGCIDRTLTAIGLSKPPLSTYSETWRLCENQMFDQLLLNDFMIRRQKFEQNSLDEKVNLWLVVVITLSGVGLSAMQMIMSYKLSQVTKGELAGDSHLLLEHGKLSLKSSVTGLFIMALSLAFFVIYVKWIYQNYDVQTSKPDNLHAAPAGVYLPVTGGIGWPTPPSAVPAPAAPPVTPTQTPKETIPSAPPSEQKK